MMPTATWPIGEALLIQLRATKYNPEFRDAEGRYLRDEWTCVSEVGQRFMGEELTAAGYLVKEDAYVSVAVRFLKLVGTTQIRVIDLEDDRESAIPEEVQQLRPVTMDQPVNDALISGDQIPTYIRAALRGIIWFRLQASDGTYIHFGWDYYMYMGSPTPVNLEDLECDHMYIERFQSPYATPPTT